MKILLLGIAKIKITLYNIKESNSCMESNPIKSYEFCQVRKEAAISSVFMWKLLSIEGLDF